MSKIHTGQFLESLDISSKKLEKELTEYFNEGSVGREQADFIADTRQWLGRKLTLIKRNRFNPNYQRLTIASSAAFKRYQKNLDALLALEEALNTLDTTNPKHLVQDHYSSDMKQIKEDKSACMTYGRENEEDTKNLLHALGGHWAYARDAAIWVSALGVAGAGITALAGGFNSLTTAVGGGGWSFAIIAASVLALAGIVYLSTAGISHANFNRKRGIDLFKSTAYRNIRSAADEKFKALSPATTE